MTIATEYDNKSSRIKKTRKVCEKLLLEYEFIKLEVNRSDNTEIEKKFKGKYNQK